MTISCEGCRFWVKAADMPRGSDMFGEDGGECRRRSPHGGHFQVWTTKAKEPTRTALFAYPFPPTHKSDWCGEHEHRDTFQF